MRLLFFVPFLISYTSLLLAQKPIIDSSAIVNWPYLECNAVISNDGNYFMYVIQNQPRENQTLVIQKTDNSWKREFIGVSSGGFSNNNRQAVFQKSDSLSFLSLQLEHSIYISNVSNYKQPKIKRGVWLAYKLKNDVNELVLRNLLTGKEQRFSAIADYAFDDNANTLLLKTASTQDSATVETLQWVNLANNRVRTIWSATYSNNGSTISSYSFDTDGAQLAFITQKKEISDSINTIWYYKAGTEQAIMLANDLSAGIAPGSSITSTTPSFSLNGQYIFFKLKPPIDNRRPREDAVKVDVWSYKDSVLQSTQLAGETPLTPASTFTSVISIAGKQIVRLEQEDERMILPPSAKGDFVVVSGKISIIEDWWKSYNRAPFYLVSLKDGSRKLLNTVVKHTSFSFSPDGKYLLYNDGTNTTFYSYNLSSGKTLNISRAILTLLTNKSPMEGLPVGALPSFSIGGWLPNDTAILIYDNYDIWYVDPSGINTPVNITNHYGRRHNIKLRMINGKETAVHSPKQTLLLTAFNTTNKYNGFYHKSLYNKEDPQLLTMGPYHMFTTPTQGPGFINFDPLKASEADKWIVMRQSAIESPNFFLTTDFKNYSRLTNLQPQKQYNWITNELITWKQLDGTSSQGILYKPENFDPTRKYPIIFHYYEDMSDMIYEYPQPTFSNGPINIPWFVSRGYLVFTPDIHYTIGKTGESVYNSVVSAAQYLSQMSCVDASKMGINGHSFGGYETNYLVTHTNLFAAAVTAAGFSNFTSGYGGLMGKSWGEYSLQTRYESGQYRMGASFWQRPDLYIINSPIFKADQVTTPLLIMHNKADELVPWMQSVEFFTGLRRLGKKIWMLQYDKGGHGVRGKDKVDYTTRITQFFDHYLKDAPPPKWMTEGIPAKWKGIVTGYELDTSGRKP